MATYQINIPIQANEHLLSANSRAHWSDRKIKTDIWRPAGRDALISAGLPAVNEYVEIHAWVYKAKAGRYDPANLYPTMKAIVDGFTDYGLITDDDYKHVDGPHMHHGGFDKNNPRFDITITTYPEGNPHAQQ